MRLLDWIIGYLAACTVTVLALAAKRLEERNQVIAVVAAFAGATSPLFVTGALVAILGGCAPMAGPWPETAQERVGASVVRAPADSQAEYRLHVRTALVRADSTFRAEHGLAVAPIPAEQVAQLAGEVRLEAAAAAGDSTAPAPLTVVGWAALYGLRLLPHGVAIGWFEWEPPTTGSEPVRYVVETFAETTANRYPFTILEGDSAMARMRVAGEDSLARHGSFSLWGAW